MGFVRPLWFLFKITPDFFQWSVAAECASPVCRVGGFSHFHLAVKKVFWRQDVLI